MRYKILFAFGFILLFVSCKKHETTPLNIDYPAAYVVNGGSNSISVIDLSTNEIKETVSLGEMPMDENDHSNMMQTGINYPHHVSINSVKTMLALGVPGMDLSGGHGGNMSGKGKIVVLNAQTVEISKLVELGEMNHNAIFSPDGKEIWTSQMAEMGKVLVYDATTYALKNTIDVGMEPAEVTFSADGTMAFVANGGSNSITAINVTDKMVMATIPVGMNPVGAWAGSDNKMYVDNEMGQSVSVIDVSTMTVVDSISLGFKPGYVAYNSVSVELWVSDATNGKVVFFNRMNNKWERMSDLTTGADAHAIAFTTDGKTAYVTNQGAGTVSVINAQTKTKIKDLTVGLKPNGIVLKQ